MAGERPDLDATLDAAFDKAQEIDVEDEVVEDAAEAPETDTRARDASGRFTAAEKTPEPEATPAPQTTELSADQAKPVAAPEAASSASAMPTSWSADAKAAWASLPPAVQQAVLKRETEVGEGFKSYGQRVKAWEPVEQAIQSVRPLLDQHGVTPAAYLKTLTEIDQIVRRNPIEGVKRILAQHGLTPAHLTNQQDTQEQPQSHEVAPYLAPLEQRLGAIEAFARQQAEAQQRAIASQVVNSIEVFKAEPGHELMEEVRPQMAALLESGQAKDLQDAYDKAVWMQPETRAKIQAAEQAKRAEEARKSADAAKRAKAVNVKTNGIAAGSTPSKRSLDETLNAAFERSQAGAS